METLILKSNLKKDLTLLLKIAKEKGLILEVAKPNGLGKPVVALKPKEAKISETQRRKNILDFAKSISQKNVKTDFTTQEIVDECNVVRQKRYEKSK